jgi:2-oxoglutarate dehydrogenase E1 component
MGPWHFLHDQLQPLLDADGRELRYVGRPESASPATGSEKSHRYEQQLLVEQAFGDAPLRK